MTLSLLAPGLSGLGGWSYEAGDVTETGFARESVLPAPFLPALFHLAFRPLARPCLALLPVLVGRRTSCRVVPC